MAENTLSGFEFLSAGVALGADSFSPEILTPEYLKNNGIVPDEWAVANSMSLPGELYSQIAYDNHVFIQLNESILKVTEIHTPDAEAAYDVFLVAKNCLDQMSQPFHTVGLSMNMCLPDSLPSAWIGDKFYDTTEMFARFNDVDFLSADFRFPLTESADEQYIHMEFNVGQITHREQGHLPAVIVNCGLILLSRSRSRLEERIDNWAQAHSLIREHLENLLSER